MGFQFGRVDEAVAASRADVLSLPVNGAVSGQSLTAGEELGALFKGAPVDAIRRRRARGGHCLDGVVHRPVVTGERRQRPEGLRMSVNWFTQLTDELDDRVAAADVTREVAYAQVGAVALEAGPGVGHFRR